MQSSKVINLDPCNCAVWEYFKTDLDICVFRLFANNDHCRDPYFGSWTEVFIAIFNILFAIDVVSNSMWNKPQSLNFKSWISFKTFVLVKVFKTCKPCEGVLVSIDFVYLCDQTEVFAYWSILNWFRTELRFCPRTWAVGCWYELNFLFYLFTSTCYFADLLCSF